MAKNISVETDSTENILRSVQWGEECGFHDQLLDPGGGIAGVVGLPVEASRRGRERM